MPKATRLGDNDTGHDACAPTALVTASTDVIGTVNSFAQISSDILAEV